MDKPPLLHDFQLLHGPFGRLLTFDSPLYDGIKASPPAGCVPESIDGYFGLHCSRSAPSLLEAVAEVCAEVHTRHGFLLNDLGIEKLWEFIDDGKSGFGAKLTGQLALMFIERGRALGYTGGELVDMVRTVALAPHSEADPADPI